MAILRRCLLRLAALFRSARADADLAREIRAHLQLLEDQLVGQGMAVEDARYAARRAFGGIEQTKERQRDARSFRVLDSVWLDLKLGARMLVKYPGLTLVAGVGMAIAIAVGTTSFAFLFGSLHPVLPLPDGGRIVGVENWDIGWNNQEDRNLRDFLTWRAELTSVRELSAFATSQRNLIIADGPIEAVTIAEMTASGFAVARVPPLLGRPLLEDDEREGAQPVTVIGHDIWRRHFHADPGVLGRPVRFGDNRYTIVGVMPEGFGFPVNHRAWIPLRVHTLAYEPRRGPAISVFGRLAPGASLDTAGAELSALGARMAAESPATHERLRPRVVRYTELWFDDAPRAALPFLELLVSMLVVVVGVNVSTLVYARTATRCGEIAIRSALGGSRRRIVAQLFAEALVLSCASAALGLGITAFVLRKATETAEVLGTMVGGLPFWMTFRLSGGTILYAALLVIIGAALVGVLPALKVTNRHLLAGLQAMSAGGGSGMNLGRAWTALIVVQVAFAVALLPGAIFMTWQWLRVTSAPPDPITRRFLVTRLVVDRDETPATGQEAYEHEWTSRYTATLAELVRRLEAEPAVADVTLAAPQPGGEPEVSITMEAAPGGAPAPARTRSARVDLDFFNAFEVPVLAGRVFLPGDQDSNGRTVVVNRSFVQQYAPDGQVLGRRISERVQVGSEQTEVQTETRTYEIVGVVADFPATPEIPDKPEPRIYLPLSREFPEGTRIAIRVRTGPPDEFAGRLREITATLDPTLRLTGTTPLDNVFSEDRAGLQWGALGFAVVTVSVVVLSAAGIYALMSFAVTRRRREIGIRVALGADRSRILRNVFSRVLGQTTLGVVVGMGTAVLLNEMMDGELMGGHAAAILPAVALFMTIVGLLSALGPARRGLAIQPTEALREE
jgi:predicted permease